MKTKYKKYLIFLLAAVLIFGSCEQRLDISQPGTTAVEDFYKTDNDAEEAIAAVYYQIRSMYFNWFMLMTVLSDDVTSGGGGRGDNPNYEQLNEYTFNTANSGISGLFSQLYALIYYCNMVIDNVTGGTTVQDKAIAEAKVMRAFANFNLVILWGTPPLVIHELSPSEYRQSNGDPAEFWAQIETDLTEALNSNTLPQKSSVDDQTKNARATKQLAQILLGKAYLWQEKYSEAAAQFTAVISSNLYELIPDFENVCRQVEDFGREQVWEVVGLNDPTNTWTGASSGYLMNMLGWRGDHMNMAGYFAGLHDIHYAGWGFCNPTPEVYQAFVDMEGVNGFRMNSSIKTYQQVLDICLVPGLELSVGAQGLYGHSGYFSWKHRILGSEALEGGYGYAWHVNFHYIRYAEVLLLGSEASLMAGDQGTALNYINQIRTRAQLPSLTSLTLDDIKKEKRLELWNECVRYADIRRWGDASALQAEQGAKVPSFFGFRSDGVTDSVAYLQTNSSYGFKIGKHELLPFPEHEVLVNPNLVQNPGW